MYFWITSRKKSIRIFYNRYLFAKLILKHIKGFDFETTEKENNHTDLLIALLFEFSDKSEIIDEYKNMVKKDENKIIKVKLMSKDFEIEKGTFVSMLEVLEMVISY